jgi:hypothetical protein
MNDNVVCDESQIIVGNEVLVRKVNALTKDLKKVTGLWWQGQVGFHFGKPNSAHLTVRALGMSQREKNAFAK